MSCGGMLVQIGSTRDFTQGKFEFGADATVATAGAAGSNNQRSWYSPES